MHWEHTIWSATYRGHYVKGSDVKSAASDAWRDMPVWQIIAVADGGVPCRRGPGLDDSCNATERDVGPGGPWLDGISHAIDALAEKRSKEEQRSQDAEKQRQKAVHKRLRVSY